MSNPIFFFSIGEKYTCNGRMDPPDFKQEGSKIRLNNGGKAVAALTLIDSLLLITSLVVGILGALSVIAIPAALSYTLLALGGAIIALWIANTIHSDGANCVFSTMLTKALLGCPPKEN